MTFFKFHYIIIFILIIISIFIGFFIGNNSINTKNFIQKEEYNGILNKINKLDANYVLILNNLKKDTEYSKESYNKIISQIDYKLFSINGVIKKINNSKLILKVNKLVGKKLISEDKIIFINKNTKIIQIDNKTISKKIKGKIQIPKDIEVNLNYLEVSDKIIVLSEENINNNKFTAKRINIIKK